MEVVNAIHRLNELIKMKNSRICAGLDPTWEDIPDSLKKKVETELNISESVLPRSQRMSPNQRRRLLLENVVYEYCVQYIQAVKDVVPAIKINSAFFEKEGLENLYQEVADEAKACGLFVIGDVKRADIGNTSAAYAEAFLGKKSCFDAITINPYFGTDGVMPFLELAKENDKAVFILVKTSNKSSSEIQDLKLADKRRVYEAVADLVLGWAKKVNPEVLIGEGELDYPMVGAVVGATHPDQAKGLVWYMRRIFFLVPGYGAQGATADDVACNFDGEDGTGAIVNSSRGIMNAYKKECWKEIYSEETWAEAAKAEVIRATEEINQAINKYFKKDIC